MSNSDYVKKTSVTSGEEDLKHLEKASKRRIDTSVVVFLVFIAITVLLIAWGRYGMSPGDEMAWGLLALYIILPVSSFICSLILGMTENTLKRICPFVFGAFGCVAPILVFENSGFDIISLLYAFVPAGLGLLVGLAIRQYKQKKKK